jgi:hypothetical protein
MHRLENDEFIDELISSSQSTSSQTASLPFQGIPAFPLAIALGLLLAGAILAIALVPRRGSMPSDKTHRDALRYVAYRAKLEELKARGEISEEVFERLRNEYRKKLEGLE